jgi:hypothetical protein
MSANPFDNDNPTNQTSGNGAGIDLSVFDDNFETAEAPDFEEVPDGKYHVRIEKAQLTESSAGDPMIKWDLVIISGSQEGRHIFKNAVISQKSMPYVKGDLTRLGLEMKRISELPNRLPEVLDKKLEVTVRTKGEYTNVYFNKLLAIPSGAPSPNDVPW